jgi:hypothetical protein
LGFAGCEVKAGGQKVRFLFEDARGEAIQAELDFEQGATVPANALFASQKFLRKKMSQAIETRRTGKQYEQEERRN